MPAAKLLSKNELSVTAASPLIVRTMTAVKVIYTVPSAGFLTLFLVLTFFDPPITIEGSREESAERSWRLRQRAFRNCIFVRPPPVLA